jgi:predicted ferric reductase
MWPKFRPILFALLLAFGPSLVVLVFLGENLAASNNAFWYVSRASALTAYALLTASVCLGLLVRTRILEWLAARWRWFDLHQFTSLLALGFVGLHVLSLLGDTYIGFSLDQLLIPFASPYRPLEVAAGVIALYLLAIVTLTSLIQRDIGHRVWRAIHYSTFALFLLALNHGIFAGTDSGELWAAGLYAFSGILVTSLTVWRFRSAGRSRHRDTVRRASTMAPTQPLYPG